MLINHIVQIYRFSMLSQQNENPLNIQAEGLNTKNSKCITSQNQRHRINMQPIWTKLRQIKKAENCNFCRKTINTEKFIKHRMHKKLLQNDNHFFTNTIDKIIFKKRLNLNIGHIWLRDSQFNQKVEFMNCFMGRTQSQSKLAQLVQYYRYYRQFPMCFNSQYFNLFFEFQEKKKIVEYNRLKVLLSLDPTQQGNLYEQKIKETPQSNNILDLIDSQNSIISPCLGEYVNYCSKQKSLPENQQSVLLVQLKDKLSKCIKGNQQANLKKQKNICKKNQQKQKNRKVMPKKGKKSIQNILQSWSQIAQAKFSLEKTNIKNKREKSKSKQKKNNKKAKDPEFVRIRHQKCQHLQSVSSLQGIRPSNQKSHKKSHKNTKSNLVTLKEPIKIAKQQQQQKKLRKNKNQHKSMDFELFFKKQNKRFEKHTKNELESKKKQKELSKNVKLDKYQRAILFDQRFFALEQKKTIESTINLAKIKIKKQKQQILDSYLRSPHKSKKTLQIRKLFS